MYPAARRPFKARRSRPWSALFHAPGQFARWPARVGAARTRRKPGPARGDAGPGRARHTPRREPAGPPGARHVPRPRPARPPPPPPPAGGGPPREPGMCPPPPPAGDHREHRLLAAVAVYLDAVDAGQAPDADDFAGRYPTDLARELLEFAVTYAIV